MTVLFLESFDHYTQLSPLALNTGTAAGTQLSSKWTSGLGVSIADLARWQVGPAWARGTGHGMLGVQQQGPASNGIFRTAGGNVATGICGGAFYFPAVPSTVGFLALADGTTSQVYVAGDAAGHLRVYRGDGTSLATSSSTVSVNTWYYIELKATIHNTTGVIQLRVNGADYVASTSSLNTRQSANNYCNGVGLGSTVTSQLCDDVYYMDTAGSINTTFLGPLHIGPLIPVGAGAHTDWTPNGSTNFGAVQDMPRPDDDTSFNQSSTASQIDTFQMSVLPEASGVPLAVQHVIYAKQDGGAQRVIAPLIRQGSTDYPGASINLAGSYKYYTEVAEVDPSTSAAWTLAGLTSAQFGYKEIS